MSVPAFTNPTLHPVFAWIGTSEEDAWNGTSEKDAWIGTTTASREVRQGHGKANRAAALRQ